MDNLTIAYLKKYIEKNASGGGGSSDAVNAHNVDTTAHSDLRAEWKTISDRINAVLDSDDTTLDELSEIVAYIKSNRSLIESVTTSKVSVSDIANDLVTNAANKPLSAAQGVELKALIDAITVPTKVSQLTNDKGYLTSHQDISGKLDADKLTEAINTALAQAKESGDFDGKDGETAIDDTTESADKVWSSSKVQSEITKLQEQIDALKAQLEATE